MKTAKIYWIRKKEHTDVYSEGYIGVARDVESRMYRHRRHAKNGTHVNTVLQEILLENDYTLDIIYDGEESDCYLKEQEFRPKYRIGWNITPGGHGGSTTLGMKYSEEFRKKRSEYMMGKTIAKGNNKPKSEEHKLKISLSSKGRSKSEEQKRKQSLTMTGRKLSEEHREKIRLANIGKKRGPYKKKNEQLDI